MALPWVRMDTGIIHHDKILALLNDPSARRYQAALSYMFAIAWSGGAGTDGAVPRFALPIVQGTQSTARLLEKYGLWEECQTGWQIKNFDKRQATSVVLSAKKAAQSAGAIKANCRRHHGPDCGCWKDEVA